MEKEKIVKKINKIKKRHFKHILLGSSILLGMGAGSIIFDTGKMIGQIEGENIGFETGYDAGYENGFTEGKHTVPITINYEKEDNDEYLSDKTEVMEPLDVQNEKDLTTYILERYNGLGKTLTLKDLGVATQNAPYMFQRNDGSYEYGITYNVNSNERVDYDTLYVFIDNTNDKRPIAGIAKIGDGYYNVDVKDYDSHEQRIIRDDNYYIPIEGKNMKARYEEAQKYLEEREKVVATR